MKIIPILTQGPYRFVHTNLFLSNGKMDFRIQKYDEDTKRYKDMYLLDNQMQMDACIEDPEYTKWLDPAGVPAYRKD